MVAMKYRLLLLGDTMKMKWKQPIPKAAEAYFKQEEKKRKAALKLKINEKICPACKSIYKTGQFRCFICFNKLPYGVKK